MKLKFLFFILFICSTVLAQKGTISGVLTDKDMNNEPLPFANVQIKGTTIGTTTDENGKYSLNVESGNYTLQLSFLGYETIEVPVTVKENQTITVNRALTAGGGVMLQDVVVQTTVSREKESALLLEQQKAVEIKQSIGAQELSRKGVSDVAGAVTKTTGITKQEGSGNIFVRGLGDRYNSTSMNGLPIPSNDPEKKNIALSLFSTDIVEFISIDKVFSGRMYGDFAGGNVDIVSKDFKGKKFFQIEIGSTINNNAVQQDVFNLQQGPSKFGFTNTAIPSNPFNAFTFENSLNPESANPIGSNFVLKAGRSFSVGEEGKLSLFATASFDNGFTYREGLNQSVSAQGAEIKSFNQKMYSYNTNSTGMFNVGYKFNPNHKINYNFLFVNSSSQVKDEFYGFIRDIAENDNGLIQRGTYTQNQLMINQLLGSHKISERIQFNWGGSFNRITSDMPDRTQNTLFFNENQNGYVFAVNTTSDNHRYYQNLIEDELASTISFDYKFKKDTEDNYKGKLTVGYNGRFKTRDFEATQFNFKIANNQVNTVVDPNNLDTFFNQTNFANNLFTVETFSGDLEPQVYDGIQNINAVFGLAEYKLSSKLTSVLGLRMEQVYQKVSWKTQLDNEGNQNSFERNEFLPSLILKYELNERNNLRFGASKTYTLPQFKERALFVYEDVTEVKIGNPDLYPSEDYNVDFKWEFFPKKEEVISLTAFGKYIKNPINEVTLASSTNDISFLNTGDTGHVYGIEFEIRKNIYEFGSENQNKLTAGFNASYMQTKQELDSDKVRDETNYNINLTNTEDSFSGASDLLLNGDVSFFKEWENEANIMATVSYSYFSDRIYALGTETKGNLVDKAVGTLDFIAKSKLNKHLGLNLTIRNILDPTVERTQENIDRDITVLSYKKGVNFSLGISYQF
jgi:hypothetical protein